jgi:hypothetical protein
MAILVNKETFNKRFKECRKCEHLFKPTNSCKKCGCFMHLKARLTGSECPIKKWGKGNA